MLKIKELRRLKKKSQKEVAKFLGVTERTYIDYENEKKEMSVQNLQKISVFLECNIWDLVVVSDKKREKNDAFLENEEKKNAEIVYLKEQIKTKDEQINRLIALLSK